MSLQVRVAEVDGGEVLVAVIFTGVVLARVVAPRHQQRGGGTARDQQDAQADQDHEPARELQFLGLFDSAHG